MDGLLGDASRAGPRWTLDLWRLGLLAVFDTDEARRAVIQGGPDDFGHANDLASLFVGPHSLLLLDGEAHAVARRRTLSLIGAERLTVYGQTMLEVGDEWLDTLRPGERVSILEAAQGMTLDVILRTVIGLPPGDDYDALHALARAFMQNARSTAGNLATMVLPQRWVRRVVLGDEDPSREEASGGMARVTRRFPGAGDARALVARTREVIRRRRAELRDDDDDVLARLLRYERARGVEPSDAQLLDEILTLLLAGHDTTAVSLAWLLHRLGAVPELWPRLRGELDEVFGDGPLDPARIPRRGLLGATVLESLRLDGLTIGVFRRTRRDLEIDGCRVPEGTMVDALVRTEHLSEARFPDPLAFHPDRMLGERPSPLVLAPFGGGYRRCVGAAFASFELLVLLAGIVRRAELRTPPEVPVPRVQYGPFPGPGNEVPMDVVRVDRRA